MKNWITCLVVAVVVVVAGPMALGQTTRTVGVAGAYATIAAAEAACVDGDTIEILDAVITENAISVDKDITIKGQGADQTTVQAHANRLGAAPSTVGIFRIMDNTIVTFQDMTIKHGNHTDATYSGGAINIPRNRVGVVVTIERCSIIDNDAIQGAAGVFMGNAPLGSGYLTIVDSTISGNKVSDGQGAGVWVESIDSCIIRNTTFSGNIAEDNTWVYGGAIHCSMNVAGETMLIQNCTFVGNVANRTGWYF